MSDKTTIEVYNAQAAEYASMVQQDEPNPLLLSFIQRLNKQDIVLDLGCGPAQASATMREHGLRVDPVDASEQMVKLANDTFDIGARQAVFDDIGGEATYHGVWANFSLLHASAEDFPRVLAALQRALKPAGVLHLGMKLGDGTARDTLDRFYSYYSEAQLRERLGQAGFSVDRVTLGEGKSLAGVVEPWIVLLSTKS